MTRLPTPGGDEGDWGRLLNEFLQVEHGIDGTLKKDTLIAGAEQIANKGIVNGYAGLGASGLVPDSQLAVPLSTVGDYIGLVMSSVTVPTNSPVRANWDAETVTHGTSLTWDSSQPSTMTFTNTGVYAISLTVDWGDYQDTSGTARYASLWSNCLFRTYDSRPSMTDGVLNTVQSLSFTAYFQTGHNISVDLQHAAPVDLQPFVLMLITRLS
jgi:hypothetical protein